MPKLLTNLLSRERSGGTKWQGGGRDWRDGRGMTPKQRTIARDCRDCDGSCSVKPICLRCFGVRHCATGCLHWASEIETKPMKRSAIQSRPRVPNGEAPDKKHSIVKFRLDINKAIAATAYLIQKAGGRYDVFVLIKTLYIE